MANKQLEDLAASMQKSYGAEAATLGGLDRALNVIPTGSLALDYELGIGGWPLGQCVGIFGRRDIGKTSTLGYGAIRNAQALGYNCAIVAMEPKFDKKWATKLGVNVEETLIVYPMSGEEAFAMLHKIVRSNVVDLVLFDSIGAVISEVEMKEDGKPRQGGQAGLISWGVKAIVPVAARNNVCVLFINQIRDDMKAPPGYGMVKQPGGYALEHAESIIVQLKPGSDRYTIKQHGQDVQVGQQVVAHILRNQMAEGSGKRAVFDFFQMETAEYPFGIDTCSDTFNTALRLGILRPRIAKSGKNSSWYDLSDGTAHNGAKSVLEHLRKNPKLMLEIREQVLQRMLARDDVILLNPPVLEAVD